MINPSSTALIMIDMQNGFINEASPLCVAGAKKSIPACRRALEYARKHAVSVYHIVRRYAADGSDVEPCRYDTWKDGRPLSNACPEEIGPSEPAELAPLAGEAIIVKPRFSAFSKQTFMRGSRGKGLIRCCLRARLRLIAYVLPAMMHFPTTTTSLS